VLLASQLLGLLFNILTVLTVWQHVSLLLLLLLLTILL